ncbi:hypothetical protein HUJ05_003635 [Dendroctonus ponderosae]|nr:hypothetical protein HUJ05_003635 [Dendroctonus ponderosae]
MVGATRRLRSRKTSGSSSSSRGLWEFLPDVSSTTAVDIIKGDEAAGSRAFRLRLVWFNCWINPVVFMQPSRVCSCVEDGMSTSSKRIWWPSSGACSDTADFSVCPNLRKSWAYLPYIHGVAERIGGWAIAFFGCLGDQKNHGKLAHTGYRKPTHTDRNSTKTLNSEDRSETTETHGERKSWACLPYIHGVTDKIGKILEKHQVKTIFKPTRTIQQTLRSAKDKRDPLSAPRVYRVPCSCGRAYIGTTKRSINTRITEHKRRYEIPRTCKNSTDSFCYICELEELSFPENSDESRLFIDASKISLKAVLLHNENKHPSVPLAHTTNMKENYANLENICADLKVVTLLLDCKEDTPSFAVFYVRGTVARETKITKAVLVNVLFTSHGSDRVVACRKHRLKFDNRHLVPINVFQNVHFGVLRN